MNGYGVCDSTRKCTAPQWQEPSSFIRKPPRKRLGNDNLSARFATFRATEPRPMHHRRLSFLLLLWMLVTLGGCATLVADPLPSWNEGATKQAIVALVRATTDSTSKDYVPPEQRVATFDMDGTLWVEHPMYTQVVFALDRVREMIRVNPALANQEPYKAIAAGDRAALATL